MKPYHILLVEDDQPIMDENARRLEAEGYRVSAAATLAEGRSAVRAQAPDLAVVDILLPPIPASPPPARPPFLISRSPYCAVACPV